MLLNVNVMSLVSPTLSELVAIPMLPIVAGEYDVTLNDDVY